MKYFLSILFLLAMPACANDVVHVSAAPLPTDSITTSSPVALDAPVCGTVKETGRPVRIERAVVLLTSDDGELHGPYRWEALSEILEQVNVTECPAQE